MHENTTNSQNTKPDLPPASGMMPVISQGTAATDNLSALMKNTVIPFGNTPVIINRPYIQKPN